MPIDSASAIVQLNALTMKFDARAAAVKQLYPDLCTVTQSNGYDERYAGLGAMPAVREWLGDRIFNRLLGQEFTLVNRDWENSVAIEKNNIDDDRIGLYSLPLEQLGQQAAEHPNELMLDTLIAGETTACMDGQYFFDTDHAIGDSGTQSNDLSYTVSSLTAVTVAEFKAAFNQARNAMMQFKRDNGKLWHSSAVVGQQSFKLLVPTALNQVAREALTAIYATGGGSNIVVDAPEIIEIPYLDTVSTVKFYLLKTDAVLRPLIFQQRRPLGRQMKGLDDREFRDVKFMTDARYTCGYGAWWGAVLTTLTT